MCIYPLQYKYLDFVSCSLYKSFQSSHDHLVNCLIFVILKQAENLIFCLVELSELSFIQKSGSARFILLFSHVQKTNFRNESFEDKLHSHLIVPICVLWLI